MSSPNFVLLEGYVARGAELREVGSRGNSVLAFALAVSNGRNRDGESLGTSYFDVEFWNPSERIADAIIDASEDDDSSLKVGIRARLKQDRWENDEGETRSRVKLAATTVFIPNYSENQNSDDDEDEGRSRRRSKKKSKRRGGGGRGKKKSRRSSGGSKKRSRRTAEEDTGVEDEDDFEDDEDDDDVPF